jgi:hypothetical protein
MTIGTGAQDKAMPAETATYRASDLPGYPLVLRNCLTCHSAQYVSTQPPTSPRSYWDATVRKMQKPFGALFPAEDVPAMVDYLSKEYGAECQSRASGLRVRAEDRTLARIDFSVTTTENGPNANARRP